MDQKESGNISKEIASVKEAISLYGERIARGKPDRGRTQLQPFAEKASSKARELQLAKKDISRFSDSKTLAVCMRDQAEMVLFSARKTVKDLSLRIEESKLKAQAKNSELKTLLRSERNGDPLNVDNHHYEDVMRELKLVKQELSNLKLDMAYLSEMKTQADEETDASNSRTKSYSSSIEALQKDIEEANEEQVLVELARIEALREFEAIEAQRAAKAISFLSSMEETRKRIEEVVQEVDSSKELEARLAIASSDVEVLQNELKLVKTMDKSLWIKKTSDEEQRKEESETSALLERVTKELEAANKELACIKEEGFQFMASMDIIRDELNHVSEETMRFKNLEQKADSTIQNLNSKLLRAKSKLEAVSSSEEKAKAIVSSLSGTFQQLTTEAEAAMKERQLVIQEAKSLTEETQKTEIEIDLAEERLLAAMEDLEAVKASEALALNSLKTLTERAMKARDAASEHNSTITISHFEYKYLNGRAEGVEEIADKKVAAAQAWIEALKAGEKEILMKTEKVLKEMRELKVVEEKELYIKEKSQLANKTAVEGELGRLRQQSGRQMEEGNSQLEVAFPRKPIKDNGNSIPIRKVNPRRLSSPGARYVGRSNSIALKKRTKVMPNLVKLFGSKATENDL